MWTLVDNQNNPVKPGATVTSFRGESATLKGGQPPHHTGSTGRVWTTAGEYFPSVYNLKWISTADEA
jgi:hypothetical protein